MQVSCLFFDRLEACSAEQCSYSKTNFGEHSLCWTSLYTWLVAWNGYENRGMSSGCSQVLPKIPYPCNTNFGKCFQANACPNCMILTFFNFAISVICCHMKKKLCNSKCGFNFSYMWNFDRLTNFNWTKAIVKISALKYFFPKYNFNQFDGNYMQSFWLHVLILQYFKSLLYFSWYC